MGTQCNPAISNRPDNPGIGLEGEELNISSRENGHTLSISHLTRRVGPRFTL